MTREYLMSRNKFCPTYYSYIDFLDFLKILLNYNFIINLFIAYL